MRGLGSLRAPAWDCTPRPEARRLETLAQPFYVLFHAVLHDLTSMVHRAKMSVDAPYHCLPAVPEFLCHSVHAHRRAVVEGLQARGAVRVPEDLRGDLARVPARTRRDSVDELSEVH